MDINSASSSIGGGFGSASRMVERARINTYERGGVSGVISVKLNAVKPEELRHVTPIQGEQRAKERPVKSLGTFGREVSSVSARTSSPASTIAESGTASWRSSSSSTSGDYRVEDDYSVDDRRLNQYGYVTLENGSDWKKVRVTFDLDAKQGGSDAKMAKPAPVIASVRTVEAVSPQPRTSVRSWLENAKPISDITTGEVLSNCEKQVHEIEKTLHAIDRTLQDVGKKVEKHQAIKRASAKLTKKAIEVLLTPGEALEERQKMKKNLESYKRLLAQNSMQTL